MITGDNGKYYKYGVEIDPDHRAIWRMEKVELVFAQLINLLETNTATRVNTNELMDEIDHLLRHIPKPE